MRAKNTSSSEGWWTSTSSTVIPAASRARTTVRGQPAPAAHRCPQPAAVLAQRGPRRRRTVPGRPRAAGFGLAERDLEPGAADLRLELGRRAVGDHPTVVDDDDPVGELVGLVEVLGGQQQGHAVGDELADHVPHPEPAGGVEPGRRLVEEEHRRPGDQAGREVEAAAHPARVPFRIRPPASVSSNWSRSSVARARASRRRRPLRRPTITRFCRPVRTSSSGGVLRRHPDAALHGGRLADHVVAGDPGPAAVGPAQRGQDADGGGLAGPVRPEHAEDRTRPAPAGRCRPGRRWRRTAWSALRPRSSEGSLSRPAYWSASKELTIT